MASRGHLSLPWGILVLKSVFSNSEMNCELEALLEARVLLVFHSKAGCVSTHRAFKVKPGP